MNLAFGLDFTDLNNLAGLTKLDQIFLKFLQEANYFLHEKLITLRNNPDKIDQTSYSQFLLDISPILDDFLAQFFGIEQEVTKLRFTHKEFNIIYECKRRFVHRIALKKYSYEKLLEFNFDTTLIFLEKSLGVNFTEQKFAHQILEWQLNEDKYSYELNEAAKYSAFMVHNNTDSILFSKPCKIDQDNLIDIHKVEKYKKRLRIGFDFFDPELNAGRALNGAHYCIYCHKQGKDSCSKGLTLNNKYSKLDPLFIRGTKIFRNEKTVSKSGCPLKQKISEMNYVKAKGFNLAALAIITIDNPMVAATGHRICNDCANACIYQKQEPVDIPLIESNILQEILLLPYGVEIYLLLTNWNPLNIFAPLPKPSTNYKILVAGIGPAGFSLCYYLLREGHIVVAIDGLKINPLLFDSDKPIKYWSEYQKNLSEKLPSGFGGVMEYGITPRWNKNNLVIIHLLLQRQSNFRLFGGVSLGNNIMIHQVISSNKWHSGQVKQKVKQEDIPSVLRFSKANFSKDKSINLGFDHLAICIGADTPKLITMKNFLAKGVRTASDILMTIQSGGAFLKESMTNLLIRMPIVIIGGGLTSIDVAVETLIYYKLQVEKFYKKYQTLVSKHGLDHTQENWTKEEQLIAEEFIAHAKLFAKASDKATTLNILKELGGATIFYKGKIKDSPAYRLNPDEMAYAMAMNIEFMEDMAPVGINVDQYEYAESIEFNNVKFNNLGIREKFRARTVIIAIGTENHHNFLKNIYGKLGLDGASLEEKITYFGDCNPLFAGSVVKAIASSKEGYKFIGAKLAKNEPVCDINPTNFFSKLKYLLTSSIKEVNILSTEIIELVVHSPMVAKNFQPGQFFRLQNYSANIQKIIEPLALTGVYVNPQKGLINLIICDRGKSSKLCKFLVKNEKVLLMGPTGKPTEILKNINLMVIGSGIWNAGLISITQLLKNNNCKIIYFAGYKKLHDRFYQEMIENSSDIVIWCCEEGILTKNRESDISIKGSIIDGIKYHLQGKNKMQEFVKAFFPLRKIIVAGNPLLMKTILDIKEEIFGEEIPLIVNLNSSMQCMMKGICGQCVQKVTGKQQYVFVCACQEYDAKIVDFIGLKNRLAQNSLQELVASKS